MSTRKPKLPLWYTTDSPLLWLQTITATVDRNAAAMCHRQWLGSYTAPAGLSRPTRGRVH
jgi:hypothetical protein